MIINATEALQNHKRFTHSCDGFENVLFGFPQQIALVKVQVYLVI